MKKLVLLTITVIAITTMTFGGLFSSAQNTSINVSLSNSSKGIRAYCIENQVYYRLFSESLVQAFIEKKQPDGSLVSVPKKCNVNKSIN